MRFLLVLFCGGLFACVSCQSVCVKTGSCSCSFGDKHIDLSPLEGSGTPRFKDQPDPGSSNQYSYNPCKSFTENSCDNVAVCQVIPGGGEYPAGAQDSAEFITDLTSGDVTITYSSTDNVGFTRTSNVKLQCTAQGSPDVLDVGGEDPNTPGIYNFQLNSYHCCAKGGGGDITVDVTINVGAILLIVFFSVLVVYFVAGMMVQKFARKAQGREIVPNYTFWAALPGLIKDGVLFVVRGCKTSPHYNKI